MLSARPKNDASDVPILYVARDAERASGMEPSPSYRILTNRSSLAEELAARYPAFVTIVDPKSADSALDTITLLKSDTCVKLVADTGSSLLVFKNSPIIEALCTENGWTLLNPPASLAEKAENKISQVLYLGSVAETRLPPYRVAPLKELSWDDARFEGRPRIVQWAHGHTGDGTILISTPAELAALQKKFPDRPARMTALVKGPSFTVNAVAATDAVLVGNISYQITGIAPFTDNQFATVGNDWGATHTILSEDEVAEIHIIAREVGDRLRTDGWRGLFGIDVMKDDELGRIFLIEVNARQPASTAFESALQEANRAHGVIGATMFEAHLAALKNIASADIGPIAEINDGAQIVQRITSKTQSIPDDVVGSLELAGYAAVAYANADLNADLLRIQSVRGVMEGHDKLNARGEEIRQAMLSLER